MFGTRTVAIEMSLGFSPSPCICNLDVSLKLRGRVWLTFWDVARMALLRFRSANLCWSLSFWFTMSFSIFYFAAFSSFSCFSTI